MISINVFNADAILTGMWDIYQQTKFQGIVKYFFHVQGYAHSKWYNQ